MWLTREDKEEIEREVVRGDKEDERGVSKVCAVLVLTSEGGLDKSRNIILNEETLGTEAEKHKADVVLAEKGNARSLKITLLLRYNLPSIDKQPLCLRL